MKRYALLPLITLALSACGGGEGGSENSTQPSALSAVEGKIENVSGSAITVNGQQFQVGSVSYRNQSIPASILAADMNVSLNTGARAAMSAKSGSDVQLDPTFTGKITEIDPKLGTFKVSGVSLTFSNLSNQIKNGDWVMVSTLPTANAGYKVLSVIKFEYDADGMVEVEGRISDIDFNNKSFKVGSSLKVWFAGADINNAKKLRNGAWVEVFGRTQENAFGVEAVTAEKIMIKSFSGVNGRGEIEGIVTWVDKDYSRFEVNYRGIFEIHKSTKYDCEDGDICNNYSLREGMEVEVDYVANAKGNFAKEIEFEDDSDVDGDWDKFEFKMKGYADNLDDTELSFEIGGVKVYTDNNTEFDDELNFDSIGNCRLEVEGVIINGDHVAREIECEDD